MLLWLAGIAVKSHGGADAYSFCNAVSVAVELVAHHINTRIMDEIGHIPAAKTPIKPETVEEGI